jgi:hypothetical protein
MIAIKNKVVTNGLQYYVDIANSRCYTSGSATVTDLSGTVISGSVLTGSIVNSPTSSTEGQGCLLFDTASAKYINLGLPNNIIGRQVPITICAFFNITNNTQVWNPVYSIYNGLSNGQIYQLVRIDTGVLNYFTSNAAGTFQNVVGPSLTANTWHYAAVVVSGSISSATCSLFVDKDYQSATPLAAMTASVSMTTPVHIGHSGLGEYFNGKMGVVMFYDRALTNEEIYSNYHALKSRYGMS